MLEVPFLEPESPGTRLSSSIMTYPTVISSKLAMQDEGCFVFNKADTQQMEKLFARVLDLGYQHLRDFYYGGKEKHNSSFLPASVQCKLDP